MVHKVYVFNTKRSIKQPSRVLYC